MKYDIEEIPEFKTEKTIESISSKGVRSEFSVEGRTNSVDAPLFQNLEKTARVAFQLAVHQYEQHSDKKLKTILIDSGYRTSEEQLRLYRPFLGWVLDGKPNDRKVNAANIPGTSLHEFGLAVDVISKLDRQLVSKIMNDNGWKDNKPKEPWHFEFVSISETDRIKKARKVIRNQYSNKLVKDLEDSHEAKKNLKELEEKYSNTLLRGNALRASLVLRRKRLVLVEEKIAASEVEIKGVGSLIDLQGQILASLKRRLDNMIYDRCPNGASFEDCNHTVEKSEFNIDRSKVSQDQGTARQEVKSLEERKARLLLRKSSSEKLLKLGIGNLNSGIGKLNQERQVLRDTTDLMIISRNEIERLSLAIQQNVSIISKAVQAIIV